MKITTFNPMILTKEADAVIKLFEALGFEKRHAPVVDTGRSTVTSVRMTDANGNHVDVADVKSVPQDMTIIRMNVDNFEEAYQVLLSHGFKNSRDNDETVNTKNNKSALMRSPSGFAFDLCQHVKNEEE